MMSLESMEFLKKDKLCRTFRHNACGEQQHGRKHDGKQKGWDICRVRML
jgi:hypothetical protein